MPPAPTAGGAPRAESPASEPSVEEPARAAAGRPAAQALPSKMEGPANAAAPAVTAAAGLPSAQAEPSNTLPPTSLLPPPPPEELPPCQPLEREPPSRPAATDMGAKELGGWALPPALPLPPEAALEPRGGGRAGPPTGMPSNEARELGPLAWLPSAVVEPASHREESWEPAAVWQRTGARPLEATPLLPPCALLPCVLRPGRPPTPGASRLLVALLPLSLLRCPDGRALKEGPPAAPGWGGSPAKRSFSACRGMGQSGWDKGPEVETLHFVPLQRCRTCMARVLHTCARGQPAAAREAVC